MWYLIERILIPLCVVYYNNNVDDYPLGGSIHSKRGLWDAFKRIQHYLPGVDRLQQGASCDCCPLPSHCIALELLVLEQRSQHMESDVLVRPMHRPH